MAKQDKRIGNQFWKLRSKHGRDKLFASPELLWEEACKYFEWIDANPLQEEVVFHSNGVITKDFLNKKRPYTIQGLCLYLDCNAVYLNQFESNLKEDEKDFSKIITRIREIIYNQKFEGATSGFFNANIIARDLGLADKREQEINATIKPITGMVIKNGD